MLITKRKLFIYSQFEQFHIQMILLVFCLTLFTFTFLQETFSGRLWRSRMSVPAGHQLILMAAEQF